MSIRMVFLKSVAFVALTFLVCASADQISSVPVFAWSNSNFLSKATLKPVAEEAVSKYGLPANTQLVGLTGSSSADVTVILMGNQLDLSSYRKLALDSQALQPLEKIFSSAGSSSVEFPASEGESLPTASPGAESVKVVGCGTKSKSSPSTLLEASLKSDSRVYVVCLNGANYDEEIEEVVKVHDILSKTGQEFAVVYNPASATVDATVSSAKRQLLASGGGHQRKLQEIYPADYTCGPYCQANVRWLEGMWGLLFLILASCAGLCCMNVLEAPNKFEIPKDVSQQ